MSIAASGRIKSEMCSCRLAVDSYDNREIKGRLSHILYREEQEFSGCVELLLMMESLFDRMDYPQGTMSLRSFNEQTVKTPKTGTSLIGTDRISAQKSGAVATFFIKVLFRQNASWQGQLSWEQTNQQINFRSVLELIKLLDEALLKATGASVQQPAEFRLQEKA